MFSFREFLNENHAFGTYASLIPDDESAGRLYEFVKKLPHDTELHAPSDYHTTMIYSTKACPAMSNHKFPLPITCKAKKWEKLGDHLVLSLDSPDLEILHKELRARYGALHTFPEYIPHVTVGKYIATKDLGDLYNPVAGSGKLGNYGASMAVGRQKNEGLYSSIVTHPKFGKAVSAVHALAGNQEVASLHDLPSFPLTFHKAEVKPLDPSWKTKSGKK
jgi:hypothetical protein